MRGLPSILSLFRNEFIKFNNTRARMLSLVYIHNIHPVQIYTWDVNLHLVVFWSCKRLFMKMHPDANSNLLHLCRWCKTGGAN